MKNFRKILAHLWADVQACFFLTYIVISKNLYLLVERSKEVVKGQTKKYTKGRNLFFL